MWRRGYGWRLLAAATLTLAYAHQRELTARYDQHQRNEAAMRRLEAQCAALNEAIDASKQRIEFLGSDPIEMETTLRKQENLVREGEIIYRLEPVPPDHPALAPAPSAPEAGL